LGTAERLSKIEREVRHWRLAASILASILGVVFLAGAQAPKPGVIEAKDFVLVDDNGVRKAELKNWGDGSQLIFLDKSGEIGPIALSASPDISAIVLSGGRNRVALSVDHQGPQLMMANDSGFVARIGDAKTNGNHAPANGSALSIALADCCGKVLWSAP